MVWAARALASSRTLSSTVPIAAHSQPHSLSLAAVQCLAGPAPAAVWAPAASARRMLSTGVRATAARPSTPPSSSTRPASEELSLEDTAPSPAASPAPQAAHTGHQPSISATARPSGALSFTNFGNHVPDRASADEAAAAALFAGAMPKEEIGALRFLEQHPEYDGRGVVVAILDTGVDPGAAGLQTTPDGRPKILDVIDCTGSGDMDTSTVVKADEQGVIIGASGRKLRVNPGWANPSGEWRVGSRRLFDLFPRLLQTRIKEERRKKWDESQRLALADATAALAEHERSSNGKQGGQAGEAWRKAQKAELEGRVAYLKELQKNYEDCGPVVDAVVWHDGTRWRAALDTSDVHQPVGPSNGSKSTAATSQATPQDELTPSSGASSYAAGAGSAEGVAAEGPSGKGLLADHPAMTDFAVERQWGTFSGEDSCNYALNIYDDGATLSVVVDAGAHGTHVAGITAAHFPDDPDSNGVAPGAQIISCKIGDSRLGSMETGTGLTRALIAVLQHKAHVINMSYGEPTATPNKGRIVDLATEVVNKHGVIFVASAGNAGPALTTVGAPGGTSSALFAVGAYVSPSLAAAGHSVRQGMPSAWAGQQYNWSSRGPTADGHVGVTFSAPGGAIAPVPQWTQQRRQLMNGTSMASPNACGGVALLLSGLLAKGQAATPNRVRRALENTAKTVGDGGPDAVLTYGAGLIQIDAAWDYLQRSVDTDSPDVRYDISVSATGGGAGGEQRGVYLRELHEGQVPSSFTVGVKPKLHEDAPNAQKLAIEDRLSLVPSAPWLSAPPLLLLHHNGRSFELRVDPSGLPPGLHYAEVAAFDAAACWRGPLFKVPVTVTKPQQLPEPRPASVDASAPTPGTAEAVPGPAGGAVHAMAYGEGGAALGPHAAAANGGGYGQWDSGNGSSSNGGGNGVQPYTLQLGPLEFVGGREFRHFVAVPEGATWAELSLRSGAYDTPKTFLFRATQLAPSTRYTDTETRSAVTLSPGSEYQSTFTVLGGATLEVTLCQFWSSLGPSTLELNLAFYGVGLGEGELLTLDGAAGPKKFTVHSPLRRQRIKADAKLTGLCIPLRPTESSIEPLRADRDALPDGRAIYKMVLVYKLSVTEAGKYRPTLPMTNKFLYDSPLEAQMCMVFDANKRLLYTGDAYPEPVKLSKGDHTIRVLLRHDSLELLEKLKGSCLVVVRELEGGGVAVPVYESHAAALSAGSQAGEMFIGAGDRAAMFLGPVPEDKLPKDATPGRTLEGRLSLGQAKRGSQGAAPAKFPITYVVAPPANDKAAAAGKDSDKAGSGATDDGSETKAAEQKLAEAVRDAKLKLLKELKGEADERLYEQLVSELKREWPSHLPLLLEVLRRLDGLDKDKRLQRLPDIISAADDVIAAVDTQALAVFLAMRAPDEATAAGAFNPAAVPAVAGADGSAAASVGAVDAASAGSAAAAAAAPAAPSYKQRKKAMDEAKAALLEALSKKVQVQLDVPSATGAAGSSGAAAGGAADAQATFAELRLWVDTAADTSYALLHARVETRGGRYVSALKALDKLVAEEGKPLKRDVLELRAEVLGKLGWRHWQRYEQDMLSVRMPSAFPPL